MRWKAALVSTSVDQAKAWTSRNLAATLRHEILEGKYPLQCPFPSSREIARRFNTGMRVARNALDILAGEKMICKRERHGTRVSWEARHDLGVEGHLQCVNIVERSGGTLPPFNHAAYLDSYAEFVRTHRTTMRLVCAPTAPNDFAAIFAADVPLRKQGCVLVNVIRPELIEWLNSNRIPYVLQNYRQYPMAGLPGHHSVIVNKVAGGFEATNHLLTLGHRRIGFIGSLPAHLPQGRADTMNVYDGYEAAMKCATIEIQGDWIMAPSPADAATMEAARAYLSRKHRPTAILTQTDMLAMALLRVAEEMRVRVPEDLSVVGFDGLDESALTHPPLTTVFVPRRILAREAIRLLFDIAAGRTRGFQRNVLPCQLTVRESSGVAPDR